jgi:hypothetical protein
MAFLEEAAWWPKAGNRVVYGVGEKQKVWTDVAEADAANIEVGMKVQVDRQGDGLLVVASIVSVEDGGMWELEYEEHEERKGEGEETENSVTIERIKQWLVHEWAHGTYVNAEVKEDNGDGTFAVVFEGLVRVSDVENTDARPTVSDHVTVMEGEHEGKEGKIAEDDKSSQPYEVTFDDGSESGWLTTKEVGVRGELVGVVVRLHSLIGH